MSESIETWKGYIYALLMFLTAIGNSLLMHTMFKLSFDIGGRASAAIISMVYKKVRMTEIQSNVVYEHHSKMSARMLFLKLYFIN